MTQIPSTIGSGEATAQFPVGGRPLEWRALEEAHAFENWFNRTDHASSSSQQGGSSDDPDQSLRTPNAAEGPKIAVEAGGPGSEIHSAGAEPVRGNMIVEQPAPVEEGTQLLGAVRDDGVAVQLTDVDIASADEPQISPRTRGAATESWSSIAVTVVVQEEEVQLWIRDYEAHARELDLLRNQVASELRRLGHRLAAFTANGQSLDPIAANRTQESL